MILLQINNNRTSIQGAANALLDNLGKILRYPSDIAMAKEAHVELPEELDVWDGWIGCLHRPKTMAPWFPTGLLGYVVQFLRDKVEYSFQDQRVRPEDNLPEMVDIPLRDYQKAAASLACKYGRGVLDMVPRSGKTRTACEIQRRMARKTLWLAPTREILKQTKRVLDSFFWKDYSYRLTTKKDVRIASEYQVILCTPNTACKLDDAFYQTRDCIIVDEFHRAAATMYNDVFKKCDHIYYRFGMTGTFFRSGADIMALHSNLANTLYQISSGDLIDMGFLVPTHVCYLPVMGKLRITPGAYQVAHGRHGISEHKYRNQLVAQASIVLHRTGRSVLILVSTKKQGRLLKSIIESFKIKGTVAFVNSETKGNVIKEVLTSFIEKTDVKILIGTSVLGEGVDLPTADSLVYAMGQKAEVSLTQNSYRVGTSVEGKTHAILVDFSDRHHRKLLNHSLERVTVYDAEPTFDVSVLDSAEDFSTWLQQYKYEVY